MRFQHITAGLGAFAIAACADADPARLTDPGDISSPRMSVAQLKLTARCETVFAPPQLPLPPAIQQIDNGTCQMSHLGRAGFYAEQAIDFVAGTAVSTDVRFTAPNGDVLRATSAGTFVPSGPGVRISAIMTFSGGTGRFENATGEASMEGQADFTTNSTTFWFTDGWISYSSQSQ